MHLQKSRIVWYKIRFILNIVPFLQDFKSAENNIMNSDVNNYTVIGRIGEGAHGLVFKAKYNTTGREVALKKILIKNLDDGVPINVMREIKALQLLRCKYVSALS